MISRQVSERAAFDLVVNPVRDTLVMPARAKVGGHLLVPIVIFPTVKPLCDPAPLGQGQLFNGSLNFLGRGHAMNIPANRLVFKHRKHLARRAIDPMTGMGYRTPP